MLPHIAFTRPVIESIYKIKLHYLAGSCENVPVTVKSFLPDTTTKATGWDDYTQHVITLEMPLRRS